MSGGQSKKKRAQGGPSKKAKPPKVRSTRIGNIRDFIGMLEGKTKKVATIEEINEAAAAGWPGQDGRGLKGF